MSTQQSNGSAPQEVATTVTPSELEKLLARERVARAPLPVVNGKLQPQDFEGIQRVAKWLMATGLVPKGFETEAQVILCVAAGLEVGFSPTQSLKALAPINGRACLYGDALPALIHGSGRCLCWDETWEALDPKGNVTEATVAVCRLKRKSYEGETVYRFSVDDAKLAGLWGKAGPWKQYPKRMLQMRARAFACRGLFADVLGGLGIVEEEQDIPAQTARVKAADLTEELAGMPAAPVAVPTPANAPPEHSEQGGDFGEEIASAMKGDPLLTGSKT